MNVAKEKSFTLFLKDGSIKIINGASIVKAFVKAGLGTSGISLVGFYSEKENAADDYFFADGQWVKKN